MTIATEGLSFGFISEQLGAAAKIGEDKFKAAMKEISDAGSAVTTSNMMEMQAASQEWGFKLDSVSKAQERLGDTMKNIVQKS